MSLPFVSHAKFAGKIRFAGQICADSGQIDSKFARIARSNTAGGRISQASWSRIVPDSFRARGLTSETAIVLSLFFPTIQSQHSNWDYHRSRRISWSMPNYSPVRTLCVWRKSEAAPQSGAGLRRVNFPSLSISGTDAFAGAKLTFTNGSKRSLAANIRHRKSRNLNPISPGEYLCPSNWKPKFRFQN